MVTIMRRTPAYVLSDVDDVKRLVRENPWGTLISAPTAGLIASHYPIDELEHGEHYPNPALAREMRRVRH